MFTDIIENGEVEMKGSAVLKHAYIQEYLTDFVYSGNDDLFGKQNTVVEYKVVDGIEYPFFVNEFWTSKQRQHGRMG